MVVGEPFARQRRHRGTVRRPRPVGQEDGCPRRDAHRCVVGTGSGQLHAIRQPTRPANLAPRRHLRGQACRTFLRKLGAGRRKKPCLALGSQRSNAFALRNEAALNTDFRSEDRTAQPRRRSDGELCGAKCGGAHPRRQRGLDRSARSVDDSDPRHGRERQQKAHDSLNQPDLRQIG